MLPFIECIPEKHAFTRVLIKDTDDTLEAIFIRMQKLQVNFFLVQYLIKPRIHAGLLKQGAPPEADMAQPKCVERLVAIIAVLVVVGLEAFGFVQVKNVVTLNWILR